MKERLKQIDDRLLQIKAATSQLSREDNALRAEKKELEMQPRISDHAIIRYLERIHGFNFDEIRNNILDNTAISAINSGCKAIKYDGARFVIKDKCIVSCYD